MPTSVPSISTFGHPGAASPHDPRRNPTRAAAFWLERDIARGVFAPTERLGIDQLAGFYGVGQSPVREAILLLSGTGLITHEHQKGHRVAPVSLAEYLDVSSVYRRIYKMALTLAVERGDDAWEEAVVVQLHRSLKVRKVYSDGEPEARELWQRAYNKLHGVFVSGCDSPLLMGFLHSLGVRQERYVSLFADFESDLGRDHHAEHSQIVDALIARDAERLLALVERYWAVGQPIRETVIAKLERLEAPVGRRGAGRTEPGATQSSRRDGRGRRPIRGRAAVSARTRLRSEAGG